MNVLVDERVDDAISGGVTRALAAFGVDALSWDGSRLQAGDDADAIVTTPSQLAEVRRNISAVPHVRIAVLVDRPTPDDTRTAVRQGAHGVVDVATKSRTQFQAVLAVAAGVGVQPDGHNVEMATRLASPPRSLDDEDIRLLRLVATRSNEAAGKVLGYSRRHTQRKLRTLYDELGFNDHYEATIAAVRWGLLESDGT